MKVLFVFVIIVPLVLASEEEGYCLRDTTEACHGEIVEGEYFFLFLNFKRFF